MPIKDFLKSRKFLFTCISVIIFCIGVWVFNQAPIDMASAITILTAPYLAANVAEKFSNRNGEEIG